MICPPSNATSMRTRSALASGNHLRENAVDGIRMDECDLEPEEALARRLVDQVGARVGELGQGGAEGADLVRDVVHAGAALREEAADRRVLLERLEQLDPAIADTNRRGADALIVHRRPVLDLGTEEPLVGAQCLVEIDDRNTEVMDPPRFHLREANEMD